MSSITNLNDYTLLEQSDIDRIYFYPLYAISNTTIKRKKDEICVLFEIEKEKYTPVYKMNTFLISDGKRIFNSYSIDLKRIEPHKYIVIKNKSSILEENYNDQEIIDFTSLKYESFIKILKENKELSKMIPELTNAIKNNMNSLKSEKIIASSIDLPSPSNYYQNIVGYEIDALENKITTEEEIDLSKTILKNIKRNFEVVLYEKSQSKTAYIALYALLLNKVKLNTIKSKSTLDSKELKLDTNKEVLLYEDLEEIINSIINSYKDENLENFERNIIQERIEYIISSKPNIKEFKNFIKVILTDNKYIDKTKRNRLIDEEQLKNLIIQSLAKQNYRPLLRNQILIYNLLDNNTIDFICIISTDKLYSILKPLRLNTIAENKKIISLLKPLSLIIEQDKFSNSTEAIDISILMILMMNLYYYKNASKNILLFNKGNYILKLDYAHGNFDIKLIERDTEKKYGHFIKISDETKKTIEYSLNKSEKSFIDLMNKIAYENIEACLIDLGINITYEDISNRGIQIKLERTLKKDVFVLNVPLYVLLDMITSIKVVSEQPKEKTIIEDTPEIKVDDNLVYGLNKEEYDYIIRKSNTITEIMNKNHINNRIYIKISKTYTKFTIAEEGEKEELLHQLKNLLEKETENKELK